MIHLFCSDCQVKRCIQEECMRVRRYLHPFTHERLQLECHSWLVCDENIDFINEACSKIVPREQWTGEATPLLIALPVY